MCLARYYDLNFTQRTHKQVARPDTKNIISVLAAVQASSPPEAAPVPPKPVVAAAAPVSRPTPVVTGKDRTEPIRGIRKTMVKTMIQAQAIPHFGYCDEVIMDAVIELRSVMKTLAAERGVKFSYMPIFLKVRYMRVCVRACVRARPHALFLQHCLNVLIIVTSL